MCSTRRTTPPRTTPVHSGCWVRTGASNSPSIIASEGKGHVAAFHRQALDLPGASLAGRRRMPVDVAVVRQRHGDAVHRLSKADTR
ncbi:hypothetical protein G6F55_013615 [Rhizopus delemar]|nr:hypothetical protein G6F24_016517 [Rhizopus arrhizus]KAG1266861.1 hypothetical protein G6F66_014084 [Rhizopus arrhizus]KAG1380008.1 hypothetical protein G6F60_015216 [Rhizopus arrhizus]KAG1439959.1 hypothetical protein G6F55_013615 [Rhizopus delemar]KAG1479871.1 hypothetical protein G6F53_014237 [Rhizopus delemar]